MNCRTQPSSTDNTIHVTKQLGQYVHTFKGVKNEIKEKQNENFLYNSWKLSLSCMKNKWFLCFLREIVNNRYNIA